MFTKRAAISLLIYFIIIDPAIGLFQKHQKYDLSMPNVRPTSRDQYLCTPVKVDLRKTYNIVAFEPKASMDTVHHMILYGCMNPGMKRPYWNCGEMERHQDEDTAGPCSATDTVIMYAWARDAPKLELPEGVAFKIGKNTQINYLVLQIHYSDIDRFKDGSTDTSGLYLSFVETPMPREAGVLLLGTMGEIRGNSLESMETQCLINEDKIIHPFAFRVHTHELGVRVVGYRVRNLENKQYTWTELGERDPLLPQMFYPIKDSFVIRKNDIVAVSCKMDALNRNRTTYIGATSTDEMCNFYLMYWVEEGGLLDTRYCFSLGPPFYYWEMNLMNIPSHERLQYRKNTSPKDR